AGAPIRCAVGFHPGLKRPAGSADGPIRAKVLMMIGDRDPVVPQEDRLAFAQSMTAAGADWQLHVFGGVGHSYTNKAIDAHGWPGFRYDAPADRRSWRAMLDLFEEAL
ncbi:MAG: dienelactone hydrolase family protein, partial [Parvularculaceae bacterium]